MAKFSKITKFVGMSIAAVALAISTASTVNAGVVSGHVTNVEVTYAPSGLGFMLDGGDSYCPANNWIWYGWANNNDNVMAVLATLISARISGFYAAVYYNGYCQVTNVHLGQ